MYGTEPPYNDISDITMRIQRIERKIYQYKDIISTQSQIKENIEFNIIKLR